MNLKYQHKVHDPVEHANTSGGKEIASQGRVLIGLSGSDVHPFYQSQGLGGLILLSVPVTRRGGGKAAGKTESTYSDISNRISQPGASVCILFFTDSFAKIVWGSKGF